MPYAGSQPVPGSFLTEEQRKLLDYALAEKAQGEKLNLMSPSCGAMLGTLTLSASDWFRKEVTFLFVGVYRSLL
eukprot:1152873-Pelagomonas_calceolata.AAC.2